MALASDAHGVHVGQEDIHPLDIRKIAGKKLIIGLSVNTIAHAQEANELDVDYVGIGPVFRTLTKKRPKTHSLYPWSKKYLKIFKKTMCGHWRNKS